MLSWAGQGYDPDRFDVRTVAVLLAFAWGAVPTRKR